jgi:integrase
MINVNRKRIAPNTVAAVIREYLATELYTGLAPATQRGYRIYLTQAEQPELLGAYDVNTITTAHVQAFLERYRNRPGAMGQALTALKAVTRWAVRMDRLPYPVTFGCIVARSDGGHLAWHDEQIAIAIEHCSPQMARFITLAAGTGQRGSDLVKMQWSEIVERNGRLGIRVRQQKTFRKTKLELWVPFAPELAAVIRTWERPSAQAMVGNPDLRYILLKKNGRPWTRPQLTSCWSHFERKRHPGLENLNLHGLRGHLVVRLRNAGATDGQIAKCVGMTIPMVTRYCRSADQQAEAEGAIACLDDVRARVNLKREAV